MKKFQSFSMSTLLIVSLLTSAAGFININIRNVEAADTGWNSPSGNTSNNSGAGDDWSDPEKAYSNGSGYAYEQNGERHRYYNFNFNIISGSTINGIEANVDAWSSDNSGCRLGVDLSWDGGNTWSNEKTQNLSGSESTGTLGGSNDDWGSHTWQVSDFSNSNFRARVRDIDPGTSCSNDATTYLDWLRIKVYYAEPQVTICHNNGGSGNYTQITVDASAVDGIGGGDHNSDGHQGGLDIIPPGSWDANGRNWTTEGQAIWNNGCVVPTEICDGQDNDFDGNTDEDGVCPSNSYYCDNDQDSYIGASPSGTCDTYQCIPSGCTTDQGNDCNDSNAGINPGATETCGNQIDEDCDGSDLECVYACEVGQGGVTCDNYFYNDYCEIVPGVESWANARICNAPTGPSCGTLVGAIRTSCDDQNLCTNDGCSMGQCTHSNIVCDDQDPCTDDSCNPESGCVFTPNDQCEPQCIQEGGSGAVVLGGPECCQGLTSIGCSAPENESCSECVGAFYCTMCGDGTCGLGENECNCPADCAEPAIEYCGMYFNHVPDGQDFQGIITGLNPGDSPFNHPTWWEIAKLAFVQNDSSLEFGDNFLPVDQDLDGDPFHFTAKWQAKLIVPADGDYGYFLRSDDDSWLYIDGTMVEDLGGVHQPTTRTDDVYLTQGEHTLNLYFAERHTTQSYLDFHWTTSGIEVIADCEEYCGDGSCNGQETCETCSQDCGTCPVAECGNGVKEGEEQCDGQDGVSEHYICTNECTLEYVPWCGDQECNGEETCINCSDDCGYCPCDPNIELVVNGGFETPEVTHTALWDIFNNSNGLTGWSIQWESLQAIFQEIARPISAFLELQRGAAGDPQSGDQLAELDSDWDGPDGSLTGEPASVRIYQDITTVPGRQYAVSFWFSPRPNTALENNKLEFAWDWGNYIDNAIEGAGENNTTWVEKTYTLTASGTVSRIQFADLGTPDSLGTYLDNVSIRCIPESSTGSLTICKYEDNETIGQYEQGTDTPLAWDMTVIYPNDGGTLYTRTNGETGCVEITGLPYGLYSITEDSEEGWTRSYPAESNTQDMEISSGTPNPMVYFLNYGEEESGAECGNGAMDCGEECDDGNLIDGDGCSANCTIENPFCGDGVCNNGETCTTCPGDCPGVCGTGGGGGGGGYAILDFPQVAGESIEQQGEVLGESVTLPETGQDAVLLIISSIIVALGAGLGLKKKLAV